MRTVNFNGEPVILLGKEISVGDEAPNFSVRSNDLKRVTLDDYDGKIKLISVIPSIDTGVCAKQTKRFNEEISKLDNVQALTISMDLPFAQARWSQTNDVNNLELLSDHLHADFGMKFGLLIQKLRLLARAVIVIDSDNKVTYIEVVEEVTNHPDYDQALAAVKNAQ